MFRSIHSKLIAWLTIVLVLVVGGFGGSLYVLVQRSKLGEIDAELAGTAGVIAEKLRVPRPPPPPGGSRKKGKPKRFEDWSELDFPPPYEKDGPGPGDPGDRGQFGPFEKRPRGDDHHHPRGPRGERSLEDIVHKLEVPENLLDPTESEGKAARYFAVWSPDGALLRESTPGLGIPSFELPSEEGSSAIRSRGELRELLLRGPRGALVAVGTSVHRELVDQRRLAGYLLGAGSAVMALGLLGAWFISKRAMRPLREINETVEEISASNLDRRIDLAATETELGGLARVLNSAFDRLQDSIEKQVQFTADASHELRTPVSVILAQTSMARRRDRPAEDYRDVIETCHSAAARMKSLVDGLLMLARNDAGDLRPRMSECDLRQLTDECMDLLVPLAVEKEITLRRELAEVSVEADAELLVQIISNLVSNAIRYNRRGGEARVTLSTEGPEAVLTVSDTGPGIAADDIPRIFDRFYRVDTARSRRDGGTGLGLSIARAMALAHGGTLACESTAGEGARFILRLPLRQAGADGAAAFGA